jgi:hypothetical protein
LSSRSLHEIFPGVSTGGIVISTTQHTLGKKILLATTTSSSNNSTEQHNNAGLDGGDTSQGRAGVWLQIPDPSLTAAVENTENSSDGENVQYSSSSEAPVFSSEVGTILYTTSAGGGGQTRTLSATSGRFVTLPQRGPYLAAAGRGVSLQQQQQQQLLQQPRELQQESQPPMASGEQFVFAHSGGQPSVETSAAGEYNGDFDCVGDVELAVTGVATASSPF